LAIKGLQIVCWLVDGGNTRTKQLFKQRRLAARLLVCAAIASMVLRLFLLCGGRQPACSCGWYLEVVFLEMHARFCWVVLLLLQAGCSCSW
jgi:hypothetical protein